MSKLVYGDVLPKVSVMWQYLQLDNTVSVIYCTVALCWVVVKNTCIDRGTKSGGQYRNMFLESRPIYIYKGTRHVARHELRQTDNNPAILVIADSPP